MIFSNFRTCCCLDDNGQPGPCSEGQSCQTCCYQCDNGGFVYCTPCSCVESCSSLPAECRGFASESSPFPPVIAPGCTCQLIVEPPCSESSCAGEPDPNPIVGVKCVECSYFDTEAAAAGGAINITAGTPLFGETVCRAASPDITSGTDFGAPVFFDGCSSSTPGCPNPDQSCLTSGPSPGCNNCACCEAVCDQDSFCCNFEWEEGCVELANIIEACQGHAGWSGGTGGLFFNQNPIPCETVIHPFGDSSTTSYHLASIDYCGCTGCTNPQVFYGPTAATLLNFCD